MLSPKEKPRHKRINQQDQRVSKFRNQNPNNMRNKFLLISVFIYLATCFNAHSQSKWVQTTIPPDGSIRALLTVGTNVFAGSFYGFYVSPDNGVTWIQRNGNVANMEVRSLVANGSDLYVATGGANPMGVYKSGDLGITWVDVTPASLSGLQVEPVLALDGNNIYVGTDLPIPMPGGDLLKSPLIGLNSSSWTSFTNGFPVSLPEIVIQTLKVSGTKIYAGTSGKGIWVSDTTSPNWSASSGFSNASNRIRTIFFNGGTAFAGNYYGSPAVYNSTDNGLNWQQSNTGSFNNTGVEVLFNDGSTIYAASGDEGVIRSTDNGTSWATFNDGFKDSLGNWFCLTITVHSFALKGNTIFAGTDCGVWKRQLDVTPVTPPAPPAPPTPVNDSLFTIYPNPSSNAITLRIGHDHMGSMCIVKDAGGTILFQKRLTNETTSIETSGWPVGMYFIQVGNQYKRSLKLVKQ
jgi:hypothetical protein